jgi:hypothetical protein
LKADLRYRCRKIIAAPFGKLEKRGGHDSADCVATDVLSSSLAAPVSKEPGHGFYRADFEPIAEHVTGWAPSTASIATIIPQHCRLRLGCYRRSARVSSPPRAAMNARRSCPPQAHDAAS